MKNGDFVWFEIITPDADQAAEFYAEVVGWDIEKMPMGDGEPYRMFAVDGDGVAGVAASAPPEDAPPRWMAYIACEDARDTARRAAALGGTLHGDAIEVPQVGTFCVIESPGGGIFAAFQPSNPSEMTEVDPMGAGHFSWHELYTDDREAALAFYSELFGWESTDAMEMQQGEVYQMYGNGERSLGGMMNTTGMGENAPPHVWNHYIRVDDLERAEKTLEERGGTVTHGPMDIPGGDRIFVAKDPCGAMISFISAAE
ncbi:MAG: VOC family protein [Myxococcota bacterium]